MSNISSNPIATDSAKLIYTGKTHTAGGRHQGKSRSSDGRLDITLSSPGGPGTGTNPEQLFAAGWSACFEGAMEFAARELKVALPREFFVDAEVDLKQGADGYFLAARLNVTVPGVARDVVEKIVQGAHRTCPYSKAIRGNVDVAINVVG